MHYPKPSKKFIGLITTHNKHGNCQILETGWGEGMSQVQLCKGLKLIDILHLGTSVQIDSISSYLFTGPLHVRQSD